MNHRTLSLSRLLTISAFASIGGLWSSAAFAATFTVNHTGDAARATGVPIGLCDCFDTTGTTNCSLRAAVETANSCPGPDVIDLSGVLAGSTFTLTIAGTGEDLSAQGDLDVTEELVILGNAHQIDANFIDRAFDVHPGSPVTLDSVAVINGAAPVGAGETGGCIRARESDLDLQYVRVDQCYTPLSGGGVYVQDARLDMIGEGVYECEADIVGGGIYVENGDLSLDSVKIRDNIAEFSGGGALVARSASTVPVSLDIIDSFFFDNLATSVEGGALWTNLPGTIATTQFIGNQAAVDGGGLFVAEWSDIEMTKVVLNANVATNGGGLWQDGGDLRISNTRVFENDASFGAGLGLIGSTRIDTSSVWGNAASATGGGIICHSATCELDARNTTISDNTANNGGGIAFTGPSTGTLNNVTLAEGVATSRGGNLVASNVASVAVTNSIFAEGTAAQGADCFGPLSLSDSLLENPTWCMYAGSNVITWTGAGLDSFGLWGLTESYPLLVSSPAIDVANSATSESDDQYGITRGADPDMGAREY